MSGFALVMTVSHQYPRGAATALATAAGSFKAALSNGHPKPGDHEHVTALTLSGKLASVLGDQRVVR